MSHEPAPTPDTNPHSDLPAVPDSPPAASDDITDPERPLPFGVYRAPVPVI